MSETPGITKHQQRMMRTMSRARKSAAHGETWHVAFEAGWSHAAKAAAEVATRNGLDPESFYEDMAKIVSETE